MDVCERWFGWGTSFHNPLDISLQVNRLGRASFCRYRQIYRHFKRLWATDGGRWRILHTGKESRVS
jgi:hypothetical protein